MEEEEITSRGELRRWDRVQERNERVEREYYELFRVADATPL